jgi:hypothetical protein
VEIRLGHVTQATEAQVAQMKELGVIAEVNLGSNMVTGALGRARDPAGSRLDEHPLLMLLYHDVRTLLSTDAGGVMSTDLSKEYGFAAELLERFRRGETSITVPDPKDRKSKLVLRYADLPPEVQARFRIEHLERTAQEYAAEGQARKNRGDVYVPKGKAAKVNRVNVAKTQKRLAKKYATRSESSAAENAARKLRDGSLPQGLDPEGRIELLRARLDALEAGAADGSIGDGGVSDMELRRAILELREELLALIERRLRSKYPGAILAQASAGSDRLLIEIQGVDDLEGAVAELQSLGAESLGDEWLAMLGIRLNVPGGDALSPRR